MLIKKIIFLSFLGIFLLNGCTVNQLNPFSNDEQEKVVALNPHSSTTDKYVKKDDSQTKMKKIKDIIYYNKGKKSGYTLNKGVGQITNNNIIQSEVENSDLLPINLRKNKIDNLDITNKKLGGVVKLIVSQLDGIGLIIEPNVELNKVINMTIKNRNIYSALKDIVEYAGYSIVYNADKKSFIISDYVKKKYYIPASIFIDRNVDVSFSSQNLSPTFDTKLKKSVQQIFLDNIANIGSKEKLVTLDPQSGIVYVKERSLYIGEIDKYITDFVKNRIQQFNVELAVVEINANKDNSFGIDLQNIISKSSNFSINSLAGGLPNITTTTTSDGQKQTQITTGSSVFQGKVSMGNNLTFDALLGALEKRGYSNIITKPNILVQNHSVGYISLLDTKNYISGWKASTSSDGSIINSTPEVSQIENGMEFMVTINKYPKKDFIQVSAVPAIKSFEMGAPVTTPTGPIYVPTASTISTFSVANIKSGDLIILSGFKKKVTGNNLTSPLISKTPIVGKIFNQESNNNNYREFAFLVKVTQIKQSSDTMKNPSNKLKETYRQFR